MHREITRISKLLEDNWNGPMWHGGNLQEVLTGIEWQKAFTKPGNARHNIYEYVSHMGTWRRWTVEQLKGNSGYRIELNSETDWPTKYEHSETNWLDALLHLEENQTALLAGVKHLNDPMLLETVPERKFTWYTLLHGIIHHDIYHSAQISMLKKQLG